MKVRGSTITTPIPKSVYMLYCWEMDYPMSVGAGEFEKARAAFNARKVVILRVSRIAMQGPVHFVCTLDEPDDGGIYGGAHLLFVGLDDNSINEARINQNGEVTIKRLIDPATINYEQKSLKIRQDTLESQLGSMPFKELTGTSSKPIVIRNLESGIYMVNGKTKMYSTAGVFNSAYDFYLVSNMGAQSLVVKISTSAHSMHRYKITDTANETTSCNLSDIVNRITALENKTSQNNNAKFVTSVPDFGGDYIGQIVLVDPSGEPSSNTEAWMYLGFDMNLVSPRWNRISFDKDNM